MKPDSWKQAMHKKAPEVIQKVTKIDFLQKSNFFTKIKKKRISSSSSK
jgi:hypothetical protein